MSEATTEHTVLSRDHARIDSTLDWYFNFAEGDIGLQSNHAATVAALINPKNRTVASADAAEEAMFRAVEWSFAERVVDGLFDRYAAAERAVQAEATAGRDRRVAMQGDPTARATERRPS